MTLSFLGNSFHTPRSLTGQSLQAVGTDSEVVFGDIHALIN